LANDDVLLVLDDDTPFEERLTLVLVRGDCIIDRIEISRPYQPGIYRDAQVDGRHLFFRFENDMFWRVTVAQRGFYSLRPAPSGAWRGWRYLAKRHLTLDFLFDNSVFPPSPDRTRTG